MQHNSLLIIFVVLSDDLRLENLINLRLKESQDQDYIKKVTLPLCFGNDLIISNSRNNLSILPSKRQS
jgi:hypothetical protein